MKRTFILLVFILTTFLSFSQTDKKSKKKLSLIPLLSADYVYHGAHNIAGSVGVRTLYNKRHSYPGIGVGLNTYFLNSSTYMGFTCFFEKFLQITPNEKGFYGPIFRVSYTPYKSLKQKDEYLSFDLGFRFYFVTLFGGYNLLLDGRKDFSTITPYRIGIKIP